MARKATKTDKLDTTRLTTVDVEIKDLIYTIKKLKASDVVQMQETWVNGKATPEYSIKLIHLAVIDEDNKSYFTLDEVKKLDGDVYDAFLTEIGKVNGTSAEVKEEIKN
jgi:hypothetical protein